MHLRSVVRKCKFRPMQSEKCIMQPASTGDQAAPAALQRGVLQPVDAFGMMTAGVTPDGPPCVHTAAWSLWTSRTRPFPHVPKAQFVVNHLTKGGFAWATKTELERTAQVPKCSSGHPGKNSHRVHGRAGRSASAHTPTV